MNWADYIDGYCERVEPGFWAEPLNALTNAAFIVVALFMWGRVRRQKSAVMLVSLLAIIGVGSFLFHTFATVWASTADVVPIGLFILTYLYLVNRAVLGWPVWASVIGTLGFIPFAIGFTMIVSDIPFFRISNFYWAVPVLIFGYAILLRRQHAATSTGFAVGGAILVVSITVRSLDMPFCEALPIGTHFVWHCLNAVMLGWMIEVYHRHLLAGDAMER